LPQPQETNGSANPYGLPEDNRPSTDVKGDDESTAMGAESTGAESFGLWPEAPWFSSQSRFARERSWQRT